MNKTIRLKTYAFIFVATFAAFIVSCIYSNAAYAWTEGGNGSQQDGGGEGSGSGGNKCAGCGCASVICSSDTVVSGTIVTEVGQVIRPAYEINYGSVSISMPAIIATDAEVGSVYYTHDIVAHNSGWIGGTYYQAGDIIGHIPFGGLPTANGGLDSSWSIERARYVHEGTMSYAELREAYYQAIVAQGLTDFWNELMTSKLAGFGGLQKFLDSLSTDEIKKLLCEENCDPVPPSPPVPSCHDGSHAGWTEGSVQVNNFTTGTGWTSSVWARPGDTVRFSMYYCWGVGAVGGSADNDASSPWAIYPNGSATTYGTAVSDVWFQISGSPSNSYLFGYDLKRLGELGKVSLDDPHKSSIGEAASTVTSDVAGDSLANNYNFFYYSPSERAEDADNHNCSIYDFSTFTISGSHGFQIPGAAAGSCNAGGITGNNNEAGKSFSQTISYSYDTAWQRYRHSETGDCKTDCTYTDPVKDGEEGKEVHKDKDMNTLIENNVNWNTPYESLSSALGSGANNWGRIKKHNDNDEHGTTTLGDCSYSACSKNNWKSYYTKPDCGCETANKCDYCVDWGEGNSENNWNPPCNKWEYGESEEHCGCQTQRASCWKSWNSSKKPYSYSEPGKSHYFPPKDYSTGQQQLGTSSSTATVNVPYSYRTSLTSSIQEGDVIYTGETVSSIFTASIIPRIVTNVRSGEAYATTVPGSIKAVEFVLGKDSTLSKSTGTSNNGDGDPCSYYGGDEMISSCNTIWEEKGVDGHLNEEGRYGGKTYTSGSQTRVVPDVYPVGSKYCVAVGISTSDSHGQPDAQSVSGMSSPSGWRISDLSCRTIAKKPNFTVWNGNFYTKGSIKTSSTRKHVSAELGDSASATRYFGSWEEYLLSAMGSVTGISSGAGFGYYGAERNTSLGLQGGITPATSYCDLSHMTIANTSCASSDYYGDYYVGNSLVEDSAAATVERIYSRYTSSEASSTIKHLDNGATYIYSKKDTKTSELKNIPAAAGTTLGDTLVAGYHIGQTILDRSGNYIIQRPAYNIQSQQTTSNYASSTLVIHVKGNLTIDSNICTGDGTCSDYNYESGELNNELLLGSRNNQRYNSIYGLPQVVIIVEDGNIIISDKVTQIDAWLIADGNINTCNGLTYTSSSFSASTCGKQLIINGPVFANSLTLSRNSGADPGEGTGNSDGNPIYYNLTDDGSIQPAEIFNLRPDVLFWAYSQAQRYSQANVTYTRELAPRY